LLPEEHHETKGLIICRPSKASNKSKIGWFEIVFEVPEAVLHVLDSLTLNLQQDPELQRHVEEGLNSKEGQAE